MVFTIYLHIIQLMVFGIYWHNYSDVAYAPSQSEGQAEGLFSSNPLLLFLLLSTSLYYSAFLLLSF